MGVIQIMSFGWPPVHRNHGGSARDFGSFAPAGSLLTAQRLSQRWTACTLVPMKPAMGETAAIPDATEPEFHPTMRERLGIAVFVLVAVVATATWIVLLVWAAIQLLRHL